MIYITPDEIPESGSLMTDLTENAVLKPANIFKGMNAYIELNDGRVFIGKIHSVNFDEFKVGQSDEVIHAKDVRSAREV